MTIAQLLAEQLDSTWKMTHQLIEACPDDEWRLGNQPFFVPGRQLYHLLDCAATLLANPPRLPPTPKPFGPHWDGPAEAIPTQAQLLQLLEQAQKDAAAWLRSLSDTDCVQEGQPGVTPQPLRHVVYVMRHNQYHLGVSDAEMRRRGLKGMTWS